MVVQDCNAVPSGVNVFTMESTFLNVTAPTPVMTSAIVGAVASLGTNIHLASFVWSNVTLIAILSVSSLCIVNAETVGCIVLTVNLFDNTLNSS